MRLLWNNCDLFLQHELLLLMLSQHFPIELAELLVHHVAAKNLDLGSFFELWNLQDALHMRVSRQEPRLFLQ